MPVVDITASAEPAEPLDVLVVGAGLSGIGAAVHLQQHCPDRRFAIVEAREAIGGTWDLFRYPGIRSDSDMYTLGYHFRPWTDAKAIADGPAILRYIRDTADEAGLTPHIRFGHRVTQADWSSAEACWTVTLAHRGGSTTLRTRFLYLCCGYYRYDRGHRPVFEGEADFAGRIVEPQHWPADLSCTGLRVVVVGSGATAVTLVPTLAREASQVTMLQRSPTYVVSRPSRDGVAQALRRWLPERWAYGLTRWKNVAMGMYFYRLLRRYPEQGRERLVQMAQQALGGALDARVHFRPTYKPWDQRLCMVPDGDLFHAIREGRADVVTGQLERFTATGVRLADGRELAADVVVLATGLELNLMGDARLTVDGRPVEPAKALTYRGMMLSDVPNAALAFGYTNSSWTLKADLTAGYVCRLLNHMRRHGHAVAVARRGPGVAEQPFLGFTSGYVQRALPMLPKQGDRHPWQVHQNYLADLMTIRFARLDDGVMRFGPAGALP